MIDSGPEVSIGSATVAVVRLVRATGSAGEREHEESPWCYAVGAGVGICTRVREVPQLVGTHRHPRAGRWGREPGRQVPWGWGGRCPGAGRSGAAVRTGCWGATGGV